MGWIWLALIVGGCCLLTVVTIQLIRSFVRLLRQLAELPAAAGDYQPRSITASQPSPRGAWLEPENEVAARRMRAQIRWKRAISKERRCKLAIARWARLQLVPASAAKRITQGDLTNE